MPTPGPKFRVATLLGACDPGGVASGKCPVGHPWSMLVVKGLDRQQEGETRGGGQEEDLAAPPPRHQPCRPPALCSMSPAFAGPFVGSLPSLPCQATLNVT